MTRMCFRQLIMALVFLAFGPFFWSHAVSAQSWAEFQDVDARDLAPDAGIRIADLRSSDLMPRCTFFADATAIAGARHAARAHSKDDRAAIIRTCPQEALFESDVILSAAPVTMESALASRARIRSESRGRIVVFHITVSDDDASAGSEARIEATPVSAPIESDEYWQYYEDCDRWGVVFARLPDDLPKTGQREVVEAVVSIPAIRISNAATRMGLELADWLGRSGFVLSSGANMMADYYLTDIAAWEFAQVESMPTKYQLRRDRPIALGPLMVRMALHEMARPDVMANPVRWMRYRGLPAVNTILDQTQVAQHFRTMQTVSARMEAERMARRRAAREMARTAARQANWYAFLVHRWAVEIERTLDVDSQRELDRAHTAGASNVRNR